MILIICVLPAALFGVLPAVLFGVLPAVCRLRAVHYAVCRLRAVQRCGLQLRAVQSSTYFITTSFSIDIWPSSVVTLTR